MMYVQSETSSTHVGICFLLLTCSLQAQWLQKQAWSMNTRHVLLYLLHQLDISIGNVYTSNTHTYHGDKQEWGESCILTSTHPHIQMQWDKLHEQPYYIYLLESSPVKIYSNHIYAISSPCADVHAQTLSPGFLCCAVFRGECTWSASQIYHIPGLYPDPSNEVSNVSVHVSISSGMSDK